MDFDTGLLLAGVAGLAGFAWLCLGKRAGGQAARGNHAAGDRYLREDEQDEQVDQQSINAAKGRLINKHIYHADAIIQGDRNELQRAEDDLIALTNQKARLDIQFAAARDTRQRESIQTQINGVSDRMREATQIKATMSRGVAALELAKEALLRDGRLKTQPEAEVFLKSVGQGGSVHQRAIREAGITDDHRVIIAEYLRSRPERID